MATCFYIVGAETLTYRFDCGLCRKTCFFVSINNECD